MDGIYLVLECETCEEDVFYGLVGSMLGHHNGYPVFPADIASTIRFECDRCGGTTYTGDFHDWTEHEEGEIPEDDEDDDEDDEPEAEGE